MPPQRVQECRRIEHLALPGGHLLHFGVDSSDIAADATADVFPVNSFTSEGFNPVLELFFAQAGRVTTDYHHSGFQVLVENTKIHLITLHIASALSAPRKAASSRTIATTSGAYFISFEFTEVFPCL